MNIIIRFLILFLKYIVDKIGDVFQKFGFAKDVLTLDSICNNLSKEARTELLQTDYLRKNLVTLIENMKNFNELPITGQYFTKVWMIKLMESRATIIRYLKEDPSIYQVPIKRPVFFITLMRTGSTFMHHLMSQDKNWRCPELWELEDCAPPPGGKNDAERIAASRLKWSK